LNVCPKVQIWRRKFDVLPPPMKEDHKYYKSIVDHPKFRNHPDIEIPEVESLETSMARTIPFWNSDIVPAILSGKRVLVVTHGTTLRGLVKHIDGKSSFLICFERNS
jgi:2,3-bisphosphoglycerate-dependent phosphoglycerate mutase